MAGVEQSESAPSASTAPHRAAHGSFWTGWACFSIVTSLVWLFAALAQYSNVYHDSFSARWLALWAFGFLLGIHWIAYAIGAVIRTWGRRGPFWWLAAAAALPLAVVFWLVAVATDAPFTVRLALSKGALVDYARSLDEGESHFYPLEGGSIRVGLFTVEEVRSEGRCTYITTTQVYIDRGGLVYCEDGSSPSPDGHRTEHISGRWWRFYWRF